MFDKCSYGREASTLLAHNRGATLTKTTSDFFSGSPPSLRSVEDDIRGTLMCFYDVKDDFRQKMPGVSPAFNLFALWCFIPSP